MGQSFDYKCPNCGGSLKFDSASQKVTCEYCGAEFEAQDIKNYNDELNKPVEEDLSWTDTTSEYSEDELQSLNVYHCDCCGGEIVCDENTSATSCPYCGSPVILKGRLQGALKPDYVIPFKNTKDDLKPVLGKYLKKKHFLPKCFKNDNQVEEVKGLYVPFWVHTADAKGRVMFKGEKVRKWTSGDYRYTETKYYSIVRDGSLGFDHIPVDGSSTMPDDLMESIEPFDFSQAVSFDPIYLTGFLSDKYDVEKEEVLPRVNTRIKDGTVTQFRTTVSNSYDRVHCESANISLYNTVVNYALYPVWIMTTQWKNKKYTFAMNGQTNKIVGNLPMSKLKYFLTFLLTYLATGGLTFLLTYFLFGFKNDTELGVFISLVLSLVFGLITPILVCRANRKALKDVKLKRGATEYYRKGSMNIQYSNDIFLYKKVTKTRISK